MFGFGFVVGLLVGGLVGAGLMGAVAAAKISHLEEIIAGGMKWRVKVQDRRRRAR